MGKKKGGPPTPGKDGFMQLLATDGAQVPVSCTVMEILEGEEVLVSGAVPQAVSSLSVSLWECRLLDTL